MKLRQSVAVGTRIPLNTAHFTHVSGAPFMGLGALPGTAFHSEATGVSADGSVVVGMSTAVSGNEAFRWTAAAGMVGLGDLPGGNFESAARGVSADGSVVVGAGSIGFTAPFSVPFRWDVTTLLNAGATPTFSVFVNGDGFVSEDPANNRVFVRFQDAGGVTRGSTRVAVQGLQ